MNNFESKFAAQSQHQYSTKVRIREVDRNGSVTNFWESSNGWKRNAEYPSFLFSVDPKAQLIFEECADYGSNGYCTDWLDMSDSENVAEFKRKLTETVSEIDEAGRATPRLNKVSIVDENGIESSSMTTDRWDPNEASRLFLSARKGSRIRYFSREDEKSDFKQLKELSDLSEFVGALKERFLREREDREAGRTKLS